MNKAKQVLVDALKAEGLDLAEEAAMKAAKAIVKALPEFFKATENKWDDLLIALIPIVEPAILKALDKIDGEQDLK